MKSYERERLITEFRHLACPLYLPTNRSNLIVLSPENQHVALKCRLVLTTRNSRGQIICDITNARKEICAARTLLIYDLESGSNAIVLYKDLPDNNIFILEGKTFVPASQEEALVL